MSEAISPTPTREQFINDPRMRMMPGEDREMMADWLRVGTDEYSQETAELILSEMGMNMDNSTSGMPRWYGLINARMEYHGAMLLIDAEGSILKKFRGELVERLGEKAEAVFMEGYKGVEGKDGKKIWKFTGEAKTPLGKMVESIVDEGLREEGFLGAEPARTEPEIPPEPVEPLPLVEDVVPPEPEPESEPEPEPVGPKAAIPVAEAVEVDGWNDMLRSEAEGFYNDRMSKRARQRMDGLVRALVENKINPSELGGLLKSIPEIGKFLDFVGGRVISSEMIDNLAVAGKSIEQIGEDGQLVKLLEDIFKGRKPPKPGDIRVMRRNAEYFAMLPNVLRWRIEAQQKIEREKAEVNNFFETHELELKPTGETSHRRALLDNLILASQLGVEVPDMETSYDFDPEEKDGYSLKFRLVNNGQPTASLRCSPRFLYNLNVPNTSALPETLGSIVHLNVDFFRDEELSLSWNPREIVDEIVITFLQGTESEAEWGRLKIGKNLEIDIIPTVNLRLGSIMEVIRVACKLEHALRNYGKDDKEKSNKKRLILGVKEKQREEDVEELVEDAISGLKA